MADSPVPAGHQPVRMEFVYDGGGLAEGGDVSLFYDGTPAGTGRVELTRPMVFLADETTDIGYKSGTTVSPDYTVATGRINWVQSTSARTTTTTSSRRTPPHRHGEAVATTLARPR